MIPPVTLALDEEHARALAAEVGRCQDGVAALSRLAERDRKTAVAIALALTHHVLTVIPARPGSFASDELEETYVDDAVAADEALAIAERLSTLEEVPPDVRSAAAEARARCERLQEAITASADAQDYDAGWSVVSMVIATLDLAAGVEGDAAVAVAWGWMRAIPADDETSESFRPDPRDGAYATSRAWDKRLKHRARALKDSLRATLRAVRDA